MARLNFPSVPRPTASVVNVPTAAPDPSESAFTYPSFAAMLEKETMVVPPALETVTLAEDEAELPAASNARAVTVCPPFPTDAEFQDTEYGEAVSVPTTVPSTLNSTRL